jgi:hypothetical protein
MFRKMPIVLLAIFFSVVLLDGFLSVNVKSIFYAVSLLIKSGIIFVLPFVIFMLLFKTLSKLALNATKIIFSILLFVCISNFISTMISYAVGSGIYRFDLSLALPQAVEGLQPAWVFGFPKLIANDHAMFAGIILGIGFSFFQPAMAEKISAVFDKIVNATLRCITYVIPVFIAGFAVKLIHDKVMESIIHDYALIFLLVAAALFTYIGFVYLACSNFKLYGFGEKFKNMLPAAIAGFGSMSSAAAMPLTILGAEKNVNNAGLIRLLIPTTVNIHLIGDCFAIPIFAFAVMKNFGAPEPEFLAYATFAFYFVMAKFSVAAIPGGGIIVMLPILESHLGFTGEMASLITALYILFDPVITCANVFGNGGFALAFSKLQKKNKTLESLV